MPETISEIIVYWAGTEAQKMRVRGTSKERWFAGPTSDDFVADQFVGKTADELLAAQKELKEVE